MEIKAGKKPTEKNDLYCKKPFQSIFLSVDGNIRICCYNPEIIGNVLTDDIKDIWNKAGYNLIRKSMYEGKKITYCKNCINRKT